MDYGQEFRETAFTVPGLPREVYYRCIWLVKDMERLEQIAAMDSAPSEQPEELPEHGEWSLVRGEVIERALRECRCCEAALSRVPEIYRKGIIDNITRKVPFSDIAHANTWKKWKQIFIQSLARELHLI